MHCHTLLFTNATASAQLTCPWTRSSLAPAHALFSPSIDTYCTQKPQLLLQRLLCLLEYDIASWNGIITGSHEMALFLPTPFTQSKQVHICLVVTAGLVIVQGTHHNGTAVLGMN